MPCSWNEPTSTRSLNRDSQPPRRGDDDEVTALESANECGAVDSLARRWIAGAGLDPVDAGA